MQNDKEQKGIGAMDWKDAVERNRLFEVTTGSRARGLHATPEDVVNGLASKVSDTDLRSVYALPLHHDWHVLYSAPDEQQLEGADNKGYDVRKFLRGIMNKPNPEYLELLFTRPEDRFVIREDLTNMLLSVRHKFVSKAVVKRLVSAAGWVETEDVDRAERAGDYSALGKKHLLAAAASRRDSDPEDAHKKMADVLRRLWVAKKMLSITGFSVDAMDTHWSFEWQRAWMRYEAYSLGTRADMPPYMTEYDGQMPVYVYDDGWRTAMRLTRFGEMDWHQMLMLRNQLFEEVMSLMDTSPLRDVADPCFAQAYLYWVAYEPFTH